MGIGASLGWDSGGGPLGINTDAGRCYAIQSTLVLGSADARGFSAAGGLGMKWGWHDGNAVAAERQHQMKNDLKHGQSPSWALAGDGNQPQSQRSIL
jgi:hypothetical protein